MNPAEILPLLVVGLLLVATAGGDVMRMETVIDGDHAVRAPGEALVVAGGNVTVPSEARVNGSIYLLGGNLTIAGTVAGNVVHVSGGLVVTETAAVGGELRLFGTRPRVAEEARVGQVNDLAAGADRAAGGGPLPAFLHALVLGLAAAIIGRRWPRLLDNAGGTVRDAPVVSATVGGFVAATGLALAVFMAFTVVLIPIALLLVAAGLAILAYGEIVLGDLVGRRLPVDGRGGRAGIGTAIVVLGFAVLSLVPVLGGTVQAALLVAALGAVLLSSFGLEKFERPDLS